MTLAAPMNVGLFCKTFRRDLRRFERLYASVERFDQDGMPFLVSVPASDLALFVERFGKTRVEWTTDEALVGGPIKQSWRTQQVVKLNAWRAGFADAFLMLDSDCYFIRPFRARDFLASDGSARFVISREWHKYDPKNAQLIAVLRGEAEIKPVTHEECRALASRLPEPHGIPRWKLWRDKIIKSPVHYDLGKPLRPLFGRVGGDFHVMPCPVWTLAAQQRFFEEYVQANGLSYVDLIQFYPWEYIWVAEWLLARGLPGLTPSEPFFLHFDADASIFHARSLGFRAGDLAKRYLGLQLAATHQQIESFD